MAQPHHSDQHKNGIDDTAEGEFVQRSYNEEVMELITRMEQVISTLAEFRQKTKILDEMAAQLKRKFRLQQEDNTGAKENGTSIDDFPQGQAEKVPKAIKTLSRAKESRRLPRIPEEV
ncbi:hypothetical protein AOL_s00091g13 [Orbilia oligospora ATCC 24927]|uniref:Uncharacterized protein n=1 Tax=Arthrobotrys oligospora (strain ATCC 24927 / CBS 115.81 / DSM 1491) TaxID=756982 RepID=G1XHW1_ARTOA|nr:hypothetical protein AOL_s00091g13 [Orbilia oligospora ATCC 24927]EGX47269.1 hypothetical protein AOL_s00091g13 [Orbilia oligospora ATCC 24927]